MFRETQVEKQFLRDSGAFRRKLWSSGRALGPLSEGRGFNPRPMLDGSGVKAMRISESISTHNSGPL